MSRGTMNSSSEDHHDRSDVMQRTRPALALEGLRCASAAPKSSVTLTLVYVVRGRLL